MAVHDRYKKFLEDQRQFFDELITEDWNAYLSENWDATRRYEVAKLFEIVRPETILDVGCGCGFHDLAMAEYPFVKKVTGIDYSEKSIVKANEAYPHSKVVRKVCDLRHQEPDREYDLVVSFQVVEHLTDTTAFWKYCVTACRPGGHIAIGTPNRNRLDNRIRQMRGAGCVLLDPMHAKEFTAAELKREGQKQGLFPVTHFGVSLSSSLYPWLSPKSHRSSLAWGTRIPALATCFVSIFNKPAR